MFWYILAFSFFRSCSSENSTTSTKFQYNCAIFTSFSFSREYDKAMRCSIEIQLSEEVWRKMKLIIHVLAALVATTNLAQAQIWLLSYKFKFNSR